MYDHIAIENFKIFKDKQDFHLAPITLLVGPNNSGKSSFIKLLVLLKNGLNKLEFKEGDHRLENFEKSLNWDSKSKELKILFPFSCPILPEKYDMELTYYKSFLKKILVLNKNQTIIEIELDINQPIFHFDESYINGKYIPNRYKVKFNLSYFINILTQRNIKLDLPENESDFQYTEYKNLNVISDFEKYSSKERLKNLEKHSIKYMNEVRLGEDSSFAKDHDEDEGIFYIDFLHPFNFRNRALLNEIEKFKKRHNLFDIYIDKKKCTDEYIDSIISAQENYFNQSFVSLGFMHKDNFLNSVLKILQSLADNSLEELQTILREKINNPNLILKKTELFKTIFEYKYIGGYYHCESTLLDVLAMGFSSLEYMFGDTYYLSARRGSQNRVLLNTSSFDIDKIVSEYHDFQSKYPIYIRKKHHQNVDNHFDPLFNSPTNRERADEYLQNFLKLFEIEGKLIVERFENFASVVSIEKDNKKVNIADFGFGFSQLLPIALKVITLNNDGRIKSSLSHTKLIIEEPEANLHPNFQSKLADFLVLTSKYSFYLTLIIETHSEYLIRRLQYLTAKKEISKDNVIIHYFNDDKFVNNTEPKVKQIEITENGNLTDTFGPGFYDETTQLQFDLLQLNKEINN